MIKIPKSALFINITALIIAVADSVFDLITGSYIAGWWAFVAALSAAQALFLIGIINRHICLDDEEPEQKEQSIDLDSLKAPNVISE